LLIEGDHLKVELKLLIYVQIDILLLLLLLLCIVDVVVVVAAVVDVVVVVIIIVVVVCCLLLFPILMVGFVYHLGSVLSYHTNTFSVFS